MPVTKDLDLYAKWSSNTLMKYTIHYKLKDGTSIADDTKAVHWPALPRPLRPRPATS